VESGAIVVRASNAAGLPDTRKTAPQDLNKIAGPLCTIADGYLAITPDCRISFILHDPSALADSVWADEELVRAGLVDVDAAVEAVGSIKLGYEELLYNACYCACEWDGTGDDWGKNFNGKTYCHADADSADIFMPGTGFFIKVYETLMKDVSKLLGPEAGYNGETISRAVAKRIVDRFKFPPVVIKGAVVPISQFPLGSGSVIQYHSREFVKYGRRGIQPSEVKKFMITLPRHDQKTNKMVFDLVELT
jgi:hypothetical protein